MPDLPRQALISIFLAFSLLANAQSEELPTDNLLLQVRSNTGEFLAVADIDHARLAAAAGVHSMSPSRVLIFSSPATNTRLMQLDPKIGLDLPARSLAYQDEETSRLTYASAEFLAARYGLAAEDLASYAADMRQAVDGISEDSLSAVTAKGVTAGYGIIEVTSDFSIEETRQRIHEAVMSQGDTVWFGDVDYQADARSEGVDIPGSRLLLFGGPAPGAMAMTGFPRLGLDAFCQKVLLLEGDDGRVRLYFNDIVALAELHYGSSNQPQAVINQRMRATLEGAVTK